MKTTCFVNTNLKAELERNLPKNGWSVSTYYFPNSIYFKRFLKRTFRKVRSACTLKTSF